MISLFVSSSERLRRAVDKDRTTVSWAWFKCSRRSVRPWTFLIRWRWYTAHYNNEEIGEGSMISNTLYNFFSLSSIFTFSPSLFLSISPSLPPLSSLSLSLTFHEQAVRFWMAPTAASIRSGVDVYFSKRARYGNMISGCHSNAAPRTAWDLLGSRLVSRERERERKK